MDNNSNISLVPLLMAALKKDGADIVKEVEKILDKIESDDPSEIPIGRKIRLRLML